MLDPRHSAEASLQELLRKAAGDGAAWIDAELRLARAATQSAASRCMAGMVLGVIGTAALFAAFIVLAHAAVIGLAPYVGGFLFAAIDVGLVFLLLAVGLGFAAWQSLKPARGQFDFVKRWKP